MTQSPWSITLPPANEAYLREWFKTQSLIRLQAFSDSANAYLAWGLWNAFHRPLVWVTDGPLSLEGLYQNICTLGSHHASSVALFPSLEDAAEPDVSPTLDLTGERMNALHKLTKSPYPAMLTTCVQALLQPTLSPHLFHRQSVHLKVSESIELDALINQLLQMGYTFTAQVQEKGEASLRGGILDVWPPSERWPLRLEFFGTVIDSIRTFDSVEQRSIERQHRIFIAPCKEQRTTEEASQDEHIVSYLQKNSIWIWSEPEQIKHHAERFVEAHNRKDASASCNTLHRLHDRIKLLSEAVQMEVTTEDVRADCFDQAIDVRPIENLPQPVSDKTQSLALEEHRRMFVQDILAHAKDGWRVHVFFATDGTLSRFTEAYLNRRSKRLLGLHRGGLTEGFVVPSSKLMMVSEFDIYGYRPSTYTSKASTPRKLSPDARRGPRLSDWTEIAPGDFVVHVDHGIGQYLGLFDIVCDGQQQEVMAVEYANGSKLYVPVSHAHLLTRYVGVGNKRPKPHVLGSKKWNRQKAVAEDAIQDLASHLLETQAVRETLDGFAFGRDTPWQHEFEASFPYQETPDQTRALQEIKQDLESPKPMDRLICGDVGYGKTEVALRAAFKVITNHKQVAVLVPTTVLAQQHFDTFVSRMKPFPIQIQMLSRFQTKREQRQILELLQSGAIDIVIGTHRLIQSDVVFRELGLLIIDEEQRFGVEQKEHMKQFRKTVDVLTLTATPIPRTLYFSLTGARDMSTIQTPPQERLPIETIVTHASDEVIRNAIRREMNRDGQIFFLHNRVKTIGRVYRSLEKMAPEARIEIAHGQMAETELASVMRRFVNKQFDLLLCTTIIESGVDIPNVNTIFIDQADRFGMSELYQLRGRVGRYKHRAYAYLLLSKGNTLAETARKRIQAIQRYSSLGAGFKLALRDLEIRGAGNLLGAAQSGHIASIGFDLYCQLLKRSVATVKGEHVPPVVDVQLLLDFVRWSGQSDHEDEAAIIPHEYIEDEDLRVQAYRRIATAGFEHEIDELKADFQDRFGVVPPPLLRLLELGLLRIAASHAGISSIETRGDKVMLIKNNDYLKRSNRFPRLRARNTSERISELLEIVKSFAWHKRS